MTERYAIYLTAPADSSLALFGAAWLGRDVASGAQVERLAVEGIDAVKRDPLVEAVFGKEMFDSWVQFREEEWASYHNHVSDWERERYLKFW